MYVYYVTHPNVDFSATVYAPSTEKARTVFLDYLEREQAIPRAYRGYLRKDMVAERISDPYSILSDVELHYGYAKEPEASRYTLEQPTEGEEPEPSFEEMGHPLVEEVPPEKPKRIPIQELSLGGSLE